MREYRIAVIPGDGIGKEVIAAGLEVLARLQKRCGDFCLREELLPWGSDFYRATGCMMPRDGLELLRGFDAIYFGAVGDPEIPDDVTLWGLRLRICQGFDQYANVRPARLLPGVTSPLRDVSAGDLDWVTVRENSEGEYAGHGGRAHRGLPAEVATETAVFTRTGIERIMQFAYKLARSRERRKLTVVTKSNAQRYGLVLWDEVAREVGREYPDVESERVLVDAAAARMVEKPRSFDVIVATNLHADILSDLAAALAGGLGFAPSANLNPERRFPSMFEPVHGAAFDIAGKGVANPIGTIWSAVLMLEHLGEPEAAMRLMSAIERAAGMKFGATREVTEAICEYVNQ
jgi:tartrate dehydrogenase/decarboxylase/D-malate dehydrogenase